MPRNPIFAISAPASAGNLLSRSHSAANGRSRSAANVRAVSRISACSALRIIARSPRDLGAVEAEELAALRGSELGDDAPHARDALLGCYGRTGTAHVRPDPAGMQHHRDHLAMVIGERVPGRVERGFRGAIGI